MNHRALSLVAMALLLGMSSLPLSGCSGIKKLTGQRNDTVLPGQREDILPPEQTRAQNPEDMQKDVTRPIETDIPCDPSQLDCPASVDQEAGGSEG
jgi:hypothetical protein